jgi:hypothetical protein
MKIVFVVKYYDSYRSAFYQKLGDDKSYKYDQLIQKYLDDYFSFYSSLVRILRERGHEAELVIPNCEVIRAKWNQKEGVQKVNSDQEFILSALDLYKPDAVFLNSNFEYFGNFALSLKQKVKAIFCWISCPYDTAINLSFFNTIFTLFPPHHEAFQRANLNSKLVTAGFDPMVLEKIEQKKSSRIYSVFFCRWHRRFSQKT